MRIVASLLAFAVLAAAGFPSGATEVGPAAERPAAGKPAEPPAERQPDSATCPVCKAPLEPGALFCSSCGHKLEAPAAPPSSATSSRPPVTQVVAAYDAEITSTFASMAFEENLRIDSILGSAFAIGPGEFITDCGLLLGAKEIVLKTAGGRSYPAKIVGLDRMIGIGLLSADIPDITPLALRNPEAVRTGETLTAMGFPATGQAGGEVLRTSGVVSGLHRSAGVHPVEDYFQTDASLPRGVAGGPFLDARGRVVGMSTGLVLGSSVLMGQSGIGIGIPAEWIDRALAWIRSGSPQRAWIGAYAVPADSENRARHGLPPDVRLVIEQVFPDSPAMAAGLRRGDGLLKLQDAPATTLPALHQRLLGARPGEQVTLTLRRKEESLNPVLTLAPRPDRPRLSGADSLRFFGGVGITPRDGDTLVVSEVLSGSAIDGRKIRPGDVLLSVLSKKDWEHGARDNSRWRSVRSPAELEERVATAYSDFDFCLGLRFRTRQGEKREVLVCDFLTPTGAL